MGKEKKSVEQMAKEAKGYIKGYKQGREQTNEKVYVQ